MRLQRHCEIRKYWKIVSIYENQHLKLGHIDPRVSCEVTSVLTRFEKEGPRVKNKKDT